MNMLGVANSGVGASDYSNILGAKEFASDFTKIVKNVGGETWSKWGNSKQEECSDYNGGPRPQPISHSSNSNKTLPAARFAHRRFAHRRFAHRRFAHRPFAHPP